MPVPYRAAADKLIKKLLEGDIIEKVTGPTDWCSPSQFVLKAKDKDLRLVTNFTRLKKYILRLPHPFPMGKDIWMQIGEGNEFFLGVDMTSVYYQVMIDEREKLKTTFMLPSGRYCYTRQSMGMVNSCDEFTSRTDNALDSMPVLKQVDREGARGEI